MDSCGHGTKGAGPYFQRSMASEVLIRLIYRFCKLYIGDMLIHRSKTSDNDTWLGLLLSDGGVRIREVKRIELFKMNSAG